MTLARVSLPLGSVIVLSGCLDAPPEYQVADRLPPVIDSRGVKPTLTNIILLPSTGSTPSAVDFVVPFRSDDAGEDLRAIFVQDIPQQIDQFSQTCQTKCKFIGDVRVAADSRPFTEQSGRAVSQAISFLQTNDNPCTTVTLILSHASNFVSGWVVEDSADSAQVTWTFQFPDPSGSSPGCTAEAATP